MELGLDIPLTSKLEGELKKAGIVIQSDCTSSGFAQKVIEVYGGGNA